MKLQNKDIKFPAKIYAETILTPNFKDSQKYFFDSLMHLHYAHCLMLAKQRIITRHEAVTILKGLDSLDRAGILRAKYDGSVEDLYFYIERELIKKIGEETAGKLHIARSRNDIDVTLYRMKLRSEVLNLTHDLISLRNELIRLAQANLKTVMPAHTHTQPAQPTTLAHYISAALEFISRDIARFRRSFEYVNRSPLGACAITTTGFDINRMHTAGLLGFEGLVENSYYAIGGIDYLLEAVCAIATSAVSLGKFTQDLLLWATQEFSFLTLNNGYVQTSSIMPQKRNPVALEHVRILLSKSFGQAQAVMTSVHNTPFGDINDVEDDLQPLVYSTFYDAGRAVKLLTGAVAAIEIDRQGLKNKASGSFLTMTELADTLTREEKLSFKMAHRLVTQTVKRLPGTCPNHHEIVDTLMILAKEILGRELKTSRKTLIEGLCPLNFVNVRNVTGGPAPAVVADFLSRQKQIASDDLRWAKGKTELLVGFPKKIDKEKSKLI